MALFTRPTAAAPETRTPEGTIAPMTSTAAAPSIDKNMDAACASVVNEISGVRVRVGDADVAHGGLFGDAEEPHELERVAGDANRETAQVAGARRASCRSESPWRCGIGSGIIPV